jgi:protease I
VHQCHQHGKLLAAICHTPWILVFAGIMAGKRATGLVPARDNLINAGASYKDLPVVRDRSLITSRAPNDLSEFRLEIIQSLAE